MAEVTVCCVTQDQKDALRLAVESFRRHNTDVPFLLWVWDNESTDGAREWAEANADRVFRKPGPLGHNHAHALDAMVAAATTPFVMTLDNDTHTTAPVLGRMVAELRTTGAFAVGPAARFGMGEVDHFGRRLVGQPRIDPCCALFRTPALARLAARVSFVPYECCNAGKYFDTGAMIRHAAEGCGLGVVDAPWVWDAVRHYGSMTLGYNARPNAPGRAVYEDRLRQVTAALEAQDNALRADTEVVVARHGEDAAWAAGLRGRVTVYDKAGGGPNPLPNVGREAHTYAEHVARRYDDLAEVTVFAQGNPHPHAPNFATQAAAPTARFRAFNPHRLRTGPHGDPSHPGLPVEAVYRELTGLTLPAEVWFSPGAVFAAHRSVLRRYPRAWRRRLADRLAAPDTQGAWPWVVERLWEALLTAPPVAHYYHTLPGWFAAEDIYARMVREAADGAHFVEIGSWVGQSTSFMAVEIANSRKRIRFDAVDTFRGTAGDDPMLAAVKAQGGSVRGEFDKNLAPVKDFVRVVQAPSVEAAGRYPDNSLDFVYIDGDHAEEAVYADIQAWARKVRPGGWLAGDDATYAHPGVIRACMRAFGYETRVDSRNWMWKKPG